MKKFKNRVLLPLVCFAISLVAALNTTSHFIEAKWVSVQSKSKSNGLPPSATISGGGTVCQNDISSSQITFIGADGISPYTFTYNINGGADLIVTTIGGNDSVSVNVDITNVGTQTYNLLSVEDGNGDIENIFINEQIVVIASPDASLNGTGSGTTFEDVPVFRQCVNEASTFIFTNISSTGGINMSYNINWGDGTPDYNQSNWSSVSHIYDVGIYDLVYTIEGSNGCSTTKNYTVFVGSNPAVSLGNPGNANTCTTNPLTFPITGTDNNPSGTKYTVIFNDGSAPQTFNHPPPTSITHTFSTSSCDISSSDGTNTYPNSFSAIIVASNPCSTSSVGVVPIYVSVAPESDFEIPEVACTDTEVCLNNISFGEENFGFGGSCDTNPKIIWDISPATGYNISSGSLGDDFGSIDSSLWLTGSDNLCLNFTNIGTYTITLTSGNGCGTDTIVKTICVEEDLVPSFDTDIVEGCSPVFVSALNTTNTSNTCETPNYLWDVIYTSEFCGLTESWNFTNGTDKNSEDPSFQFNEAGNYQLLMTVSNSCGDFTSSQVIEVKRPPTALINPILDACGSVTFNPTVTLESCTSVTDTPIYSWSFPGGTPATSNQLDPGSVTYAAIGNYTVTFSASNACGSVTVTEDFSVNELPTITNTDLIQTLCSGTDSSEINLTSDSTNTDFIWSANNPTGLMGFTPSGRTNTIPAQTLINSTSAAITLIYTVTPKINDCAGAPVNFEIIVNPAPIITTHPVSNALCQNGVAEDLSVAFQGTGTPNYQWFQNTVDDTTTGTALAGETTAIFTPETDTVGTSYYYVVITFSSGDCNEIISNTAVIDIVNTPQIDVQPIATQTICVGGMSEQLEINVIGGAGLVSYQWFSGTTNTNTGGTLIAGATASTYTPPAFINTGTFYYYVEVSYAASGCTSLLSTVSEVIVVGDPVIAVQPLDFQNVCQNSTAQDLEISVSGGLGNISYQWFVNAVNDTSTGNSIAGATSTIYTPPTTSVGILYYYCVSTQNVSGCEVISAVSEIEVRNGAEFVAQPISEVLCLGETTGDLFVSYINGVGTPNYQWYQNTINDNTTGTVINGATSDTYSPIVNTVGTFYYYVIITFNSGGCSEIISNTAQVTVTDTPIIGFSNVLICSDNAFEFIPNTSDNVPMNTMYTWTEPIINPIGSVSGASEQLLPTATISQVLENTTLNPATVVYTVTPASGNCIGDVFEVEVTVNPIISVNSTAVNSSCFQSDNASIDITITGGLPFTTGNSYLISWTGPNGYTSSTEDIFNLQAGTYTLNIEDDGSCPYIEVFVITEPDELVFDAVDFDPDTVSCFGANDGEINIDIAGGTLPYTYNWTLNGAAYSTDEDLTNLGPGNYAVSVSDANNCGPITRSFIIIQPKVLEVTLEAKTDVICFGEATGEISVDVAGGRENYSFAWVGPNGFLSVNQNIEALFEGIYSLTVTDNSGCIDTLEVEIIQNEQLDIDLTITEIICFGDNDASITINSISGGVPPYNIAWSNFGTGMVQDNLSADTYIITITDAENCERSFPILIEEAPLFLINPEVTQMSCSGENDGRIILNFVGGIDPVTVVWDDDRTAGVERNNLGPGTYNLTITDGTSCVIQDSFTIFNILPLELSANITNALDCDDSNTGAINLLIHGGTAPFDILWSNGEVTEDLNTLPPNTYVVNVTDANGCEVEGSWDISRFEPLVLDVETQTEVDCETQSINQTFVALASGGVPPFQYNWSNGETSGSNNQFMTTEENGLVILEVEDSQGCSINYLFNVEIPVLGNPGFSVSSLGYLNFGIFSIQDAIEFSNSVTGDFESILWDFGDGSFSVQENPSHTYVEVGNYVVTQTVNYGFGCVYSKVITLVVEEGYKLMMPDAFTPNEDGLNDFFAPIHVGLNAFEMNVYDTWGNLIYKESGDLIRGWNGNIKDAMGENGNYYYTLSAKTFYGKEINKQGAFVFIK